MKIDRGFLVLVSLSGGPKHGYALLKDIEDTSGIRVGAGTLYGLLSKLESQGLISPLSSQGRRQPYGLTPKGRSELHDILTTTAKVSAEGLSRLSLLH